MISSMTFGECLKCLLSALDISMNRLSKAINVDSSLVNRWINEKRIPSYNTPYIENISEYLSKNVYNKFQIHRIDELFLNVCDNCGPDDIKEKIKKILLESQGYSLECKKKEHMGNTVSSASKDKISNLLNNNEYCFMNQDSSNDMDFGEKEKNAPSSINLSNEDKIIYGTENILSTSIFLLEAAAKKGCKGNSTIYITYNDDRIIEYYPHSCMLHWKDALLKAINSGWNILLLLKLTNNTSRTIGFIDFAKTLITTGKFMPYYTKRYDGFAAGKEIIAVPEIGALSCFTTNIHKGINCAFYFKSKAAINVLTDYFNLFITTYAHPLVKNYNNEENMDYTYCLIESEENIGNRFLYNHCFGMLTLPESLYEKLLKRKQLTDTELIRAMEFYKKRLNAFQSNIQSYQYKDIYWEDSIKDLIKHKKLYFYSCKGVEAIDMEDEDIIEHLRNIIYLLETYTNYNIGFIHKNTYGFSKNDNYYCLVKERSAVLFETFKNSESNEEIYLSIEEPMLVYAFDEYFKEIWESISPINKDKKNIIGWMKKQINIIENRLNNSTLC